MIDHPVFLENPIQDYAWGSKTAIQRLLGKVPDGTPWAELWMGAHPKAPSTVRIGGEPIGLDRLIRQYPEQILGHGISRKFDATLPYLFKVLAAGEPLSIQAHPDAATAAEGFDRENRLGIPLGAPERNYRDPWPKPEVICAIEPFIALNGFRPAADVNELLGRFCPDLNVGAADLRDLFRTLVTLPEARRELMIAEIARNARANDSEEARWVLRLHEQYPGDIGMMMPLLLNLIRLEPGQAMFLPPGRLHAYLSGVGIELMGNSDNVLRGGLTRKHMDVNELMRVLRFDSAPVDIIAPVEVNPSEWRYPLHVEEFRLAVIRTIGPAQGYDGPDLHSAEIILCLDGHAKMIHGGSPASLGFARGDALLIPAAARGYRIEGTAALYKASVPV